MKFVLLMTLTLAVMAEDVKPLPAERPLTKEEILALQVDELRITRLQDQYKISEYQSKANPIFATHNEKIQALCISIGIPQDKIVVECKFTTGVDMDGNPVVGPDGKPVAARVWREEATEKK